VRDFQAGDYYQTLALFAGDRHVLIGQVALLLRCSLAEAESILETLRSEGLVRLLTVPEANLQGITHGYCLRLV
jgi:hypothetical protein